MLRQQNARRIRTNRPVWPLGSPSDSDYYLPLVTASPACTIGFNPETSSLQKFMGHHAPVKIGRANDGESSPRFSSHRCRRPCSSVRLIFPASHLIPPSLGGRTSCVCFAPSSNSCALAASFSYSGLEQDFICRCTPTLLLVESKLRSLRSVTFGQGRRRVRRVGIRTRRRTRKNVGRSGQGRRGGRRVGIRPGKYVCRTTTTTAVVASAQNDRGYGGSWRTARRPVCGC